MSDGNSTVGSPASCHGGNEEGQSGKAQIHLDSDDSLLHRAGETAIGALCGIGMLGLGIALENGSECRACILPIGQADSMDHHKAEKDDGLALCEPNVL